MRATSALIVVLVCGAATVRAQSDTLTARRDTGIVGAVVRTVPVDSIVPTAPVATLSDLITGRVVNAMVLSFDGSPGAGPAVILRGPDGPSSLSGPLLVIDGVRANSATSSDNPIAGGHPATSRLDDIDPTEIERIDVLPGPAASAMFGPDAGNGAIVVTTHHAGASPATGYISAEGGRVTTPLDWPSNYLAWGHTPSGTVGQCTVADHAAGNCVVDSTTRVNLLTAGPDKAFRTADEQRYAGNLSVGGHGLRASFGGVYDYEPGTVQMPKSEQTVFGQQFGTAPNDAQQYPNSYNRGNARGAVVADLGPTADVGFSLGYSGSNQRSAPIDHLLSQAATSTSWGENPVGPAAFLFASPSQRDTRLIGDVQWHWRPSSLVGLHATAGSDALDQRSAQFTVYPAAGQFSSQTTSATDRTRITRYTIDVGATIASPSSAQIQSVLTLGGQYLEDHLDDRGHTFFGSDSLFSTSFQRFMAKERTQSLYASEALVLSEHATLQAGVRWDHQRMHTIRNSATSLNPSVSGTLVLAGTVADPRVRLRGAFGQTTTLLDYQRLLVNEAALFAVAPPGPPRQTLLPGHPERDREYEAGFDAFAPGGKWSLGGTIYARRSVHAFVPEDAAFPPDFLLIYGPGATISNRGLELTLTGRLVDRPDVALDATLLASENFNKVLRTIEQPLDLPFSRIQSGYPVFGVWANRYSYADTNHDGVIESNEITADPLPSYIGSPVPTHMAALSSTMRLAHNRLRLSTVFDYRGGYVLPDLGGFYRALIVLDRAQNVPGASLDDQARAVAARNDIPTLDRVSAVRWRELSATWGTPHGRRLDLTLAVRNLALWSKYRGGDPDQDLLTTSSGIAPRMHLPQPMTWLLRVTAGF
jgi:outer membrane receptor protein involved in Fe transport